MAVDVWPYEKNDSQESWRDVGPVARVYIGTLGGDDRPKSRVTPQPPPAPPTPEELEATNNAEPPATAMRYWPSHNNGRPDDTPGSGDGGRTSED